MRLFVLGALSAVTLASFGEIVDPATLHTVKTSQKVVNDAKDIAASLAHDFALDKKLEAAKKKQVKALTSKEHAAELRAANAINKLQLLKHAHDKAEHQLRKVSEKTAVEHVKAKLAKSHALHIEKIAKNVALKKPSKLLSKVLDAAHEKTHAAALKQMKHSAKHEKRVSEAKKRAEQNSHTKTLLKKQSAHPLNHQAHHLSHAANKASKLAHHATERAHLKIQELKSLSKAKKHLVAEHDKAGTHITKKVAHEIKQAEKKTLKHSKVSHHVDAKLAKEVKHLKADHQEQLHKNAATTPAVAAPLLLAVTAVLSAVLLL